MTRERNRQRDGFAAFSTGGYAYPMTGSAAPIIAAQEPSESLQEASSRQRLNGYPELMRAAHVAEILGTSKQAVYRMERAGQIPSVMIGSRLYFPRTYFESLITAARGR